MVSAEDPEPLRFAFKRFTFIRAEGKLETSIAGTAHRNPETP